MTITQFFKGAGDVEGFHVRFQLGNLGLALTDAEDQALFVDTAEDVSLEEKTDPPEHLLLSDVPFPFEGHTNAVGEFEIVGHGGTA
ncbi:MAG: hypothetical protein R3C11_16910 [Planctomycetaceae bacterium]